MVQTFGKRIIGGIGAPGGGMSKAYAEGVNTGINQRMNRQSMSAVEQEMRMREQDQQFKIEDREEAKRRRAAAAAAAASAKARNIATTRAIAAAGGASRFFPGMATGGAGLDVRGAPPARGVNKATALSTGTAVPETPARTSAAATPATDRRTAGLNTYDNMNISNIVDVQGTYGNQSTLRQRQAANTRAGVQTGLPIAPLAARPGNFAAQATQRTTAATPLPAHITEGVAAARRATRAPAETSVSLFQDEFGFASGSAPTAGSATDLGTLPAVPSVVDVPELQRYRKSLTDRIVAETQAVQSGARRAPGEGDDVETLRAMVGEVDAIIAEASMQPPPGRRQTRGMTAEEGPGSSAAIRQRGEDMSAIMSATGPAASRLVNVYGPNGRISVPTDEFVPEGRGVPPTLAPEPLNIPVPASPELGFGGAVAPQAGMAGGTTYGGRLGAAPTPTEMFFSDMGYTPAGQLDIQAIMADQTGPIKDPAFSQIAEQERVRYMYAAEDAIANGDAAGFIEAQRQIKTQEMLILAQQVVAGGDEATNFGSTERLNMAASMIVGVDTVFLPNGDGTVDVYVNGQLDDENITIESIIDQLRMRVDDAYVKEVSAVAAEDRATQREIYQANEIDRFETIMNMQESEFASMLAQEAAREGEFDKITAKVIEQKLIDSGQLPSTSKNTVVKTDNGIVVISEDGGIQREYLFSPEDGRLTEILE